METIMIFTVAYALVMLACLFTSIVIIRYKEEMISKAADRRLKG